MLTTVLYFCKACRLKYFHFISPCIAELKKPSPYSLIESAGIVIIPQRLLLLLLVFVCQGAIWDFLLSLTGYAAGFVLIFKDSSEGFYN